MFVIPAALAVLRARLSGRRGRRLAYVRKPKVTGRRVYARPVGHRADSRRPSYSHPAARARRAVRRALAPSRVRRAVRSALPSMPRRRPRPTSRHRAEPARSTSQRAIIHRWARETVAERAAHGIGTIKRHCANPRWKSRDAIKLPYIGLCWDTAEIPKVVA